MNIAVFVINLDRRPDRLDFMAGQLRALGLEWQRIAAHDMHTVDPAHLAREVAPDNHIREMGPGSQCCALTNFDIYRRIVADDLPAALVLQDDIEISADIAPFVTSLDWLPAGIDLVQFEKYGKQHSTRLLSPAVGDMPVEGRTLRRLYSRTGGAACYLITRAGATRILENKPVLRMPIDHFLFSPNLSPVFRDLNVHVVTPALARQKEDGFTSDIELERQRRKKRPLDRLRRLWQDLNRAPFHVIEMIHGARWLFFGFRK